MTWKRKPRRWIERIPIVVNDDQHRADERYIKAYGFDAYFERACIQTAVDLANEELTEQCRLLEDHDYAVAMVSATGNEFYTHPSDDELAKAFSEPKTIAKPGVRRL